MLLPTGFTPVLRYSSTMYTASLPMDTLSAPDLGQHATGFTVSSSQTNSMGTNGPSICGVQTGGDHYGNLGHSKMWWVQLGQEVWKTTDSDLSLFVSKWQESNAMRPHAGDSVLGIGSVLRIVVDFHESNPGTFK